MVSKQQSLPYYHSLSLMPYFQSRRKLCHLLHKKNAYKIEPLFTTPSITALFQAIISNLYYAYGL